MIQHDLYCDVYRLRWNIEMMDWLEKHIGRFGDLWFYTVPRFDETILSGGAIRVFFSNEQDKLAFVLRWT